MRHLMLAGLLSFAVAAPAGAASVRIDFDFSGSSISVLGGIVVIPPSGSIQSATGSLIAAADGTGGLVQAGPAELRFLTLDSTVSASLGGIANVTGSFAATQMGPVPGSLTGGLASVVLSGSLVLDVDALLNCTGPGCGLIGTFPVSLMGLQTLGPLAPLPIASVNNIGNATIMAQFVITVAGISALVDLVGTEVARTVIPEPASGLLLVASLAGLGLWGRVRGRG